MSGIIRTLKNKTNDIEQNVYPRTILDAVVDRTSGKTLNVLLDENMPEGATYIDLEEESPEVGDISDVTSAIRVNYDDKETQLGAENVQEAIATVASISKGRNRAKVFATTEDMNNWLSDEANKGTAIVGDNLYIVALDVPDWWISEVLEEPNADGRYYEVAQLETQKVDLTTIENDIENLQDKTTWKLAGHFAGSGHIAPLPTSFDELYIAITDSYSSRTFTVSVLRQHLETMIDEYNIEYLASFGFATSLDSQTGWYAGGCLKLTKTTINLLDYSFRGTDHADDVKWLVYYK